MFVWYLSGSDEIDKMAWKIISELANTIVILKIFVSSVARNKQEIKMSTVFYIEVLKLRVNPTADI